MCDNNIKSDYIIDGQFAKLTKVDEKINCSKCDRTLALRNGKSLMIKTQITITISDGMILRCGHCKTFNVLKGDYQILAI